MPMKKRRIQERGKQPKEAAKGSTSLQSWLQRSTPAGETETLHCDKDDLLFFFNSGKPEMSRFSCFVDN